MHLSFFAGFYFQIISELILRVETRTKNQTPFKLFQMGIAINIKIIQTSPPSLPSKSNLKGMENMQQKYFKLSLETKPLRLKANASNTTNSSTAYSNSHLFPALQEKFFPNTSQHVFGKEEKNLLN